MLYNSFRLFFFSYFGEGGTVLNAIVLGLLDALIGIILQLLGGFLDFFASSFIEAFKWDFTMFGNYFPFFGNILEFFKVLGAGWLSFVGLLFILKCFGLAVGLKIERSRIWQFVVRFLFYGFLAVKSWGIMSFFYLELIEVLGDITKLDAVELTGTSMLESLGEDIGGGTLIAALGSGGAILGAVKILVLLVIVFMLVINFFKLISMFFIRYIRIVFLVALGPIAFGMAILEETKEIYNTYIRTFFADIFVFLMMSIAKRKMAKPIIIILEITQLVMCI